MLTCPSVVARPQTCNSARIKAGRDGEQIVAIVLHPIQGPMDSFEASMGTPLPNFSVGHTNPLSTHFIVTDLTAIQIAELSSTTYGLDYFKNPTWPLINTLYPIDDVNAPFIHIAFKPEASKIALINVICCIIQELGVAIPVLASSDLQSDRPSYIMDPTLATQIADCVASGGNIQPPPSWIDLWKRIQDLEVCCFSNTAQINILRIKVAKHETEITLIKIQIKALQDALADIQGQVSQIPAILAAIILLQQQIADILERCCPVPPDSKCFNYQIIAGQEMVITPNQPVHLNLPTKVIDAEPPIVTTGPLWRAKLEGTCTWALDGIVRFRLNEWCSGTKVRLFVVACGVRNEVAIQTITSTSLQLIQLAFSGFLQPACDNVYLEVETNDKTAQIVSFAEFKGCCI